jgi:hypothetical protein
VRRPAGMTDAGSAAERLLFEPHFQRAKLAFRPAPAEHAVIQRCHSRGVVTSVFEALERIDQLPGNRLGSQNSDDSAHPLGRPLCPDLMI